MEKIWVCVYRDTIEEHDDVDNLAEILVTKYFMEKYLQESDKDKYFDGLEDFLNEYTADDTEDLYGYAKAYNAVIKTRLCNVYV